MTWPNFLPQNWSKNLEISHIFEEKMKRNFGNYITNQFFFKAILFRESRMSVGLSWVSDDVEVIDNELSLLNQCASVSILIILIGRRQNVWNLNLFRGNFISLTISLVLTQISYLQRYWFQKSGLRFSISRIHSEIVLVFTWLLKFFDYCWKEQHTELNFLMMISSTFVVYFPMLCTFSVAYFLWVFSLFLMCIMFSLVMWNDDRSHKRFFFGKIWKYTKETSSISWKSCWNTET